MKNVLIAISIILCMGDGMLPAFCDSPSSIMDFDKEISIQLKDAKIKDVLGILSQLSGYNFIVHECVQGVVTLELESVPFNIFFQLLLDYADLEWVQTENDIRITCREKSTEDKTRSIDDRSHVRVTLKIVRSDANGEETVLYSNNLTIQNGEFKQITSLELTPQGRILCIRDLDQDGIFRDAYHPDFELRLVPVIEDREQLKFKTACSVYRGMNGSYQTLHSSKITDFQGCSEELEILELAFPDGEAYRVFIEPEKIIH